METSGKSLLCGGNRCQLRTLSSFEADTYFIFSQTQIHFAGFYY